MDAARADLRRYADGARAVLAPLPPGAAKDALTAICHQVIDRTG